MASPNSSTHLEKAIPSEIYGIICQDSLLSKHDLRTLCFVSRTFCEEAERILYSSVELNDQDRLRSFCDSVIRRPLLALSLRQLVLHMSPQPSIDPDDRSRIVRVLHLSTNLQDLRILGQTKSALSMENWILEGHEFKLTTFANSYFFQGKLRKFLESQSELETLMFTWRTATRLYGTPLPHTIKNLSCPGSIVQELCDLPLASTVTLERLQITIVQSLSLWAPDIFFERIKGRFGGETIKTFSIRKFATRRDWNMTSIIASVAKHWPAIIFLEIRDYTEEPPRSSQSDSFPFNSAKFTHIETLIIRPPVTSGRMRRRQTDIWFEIRTKEERLAVAKRSCKPYQP
ncbi:hypothetical protein BDN70DRAFT_877126 [Pholiota conissans]|uniref:Uncharacterized protein n=1 Tax=Pholiota conissans TaxID=109636 RepID=A0A9P5Z698_9AGAR|nr:hypothetical protein BDN70DRAFT_877126 [Pholiota conissans]